MSQVFKKTAETASKAWAKDFDKVHHGKAMNSYNGRAVFLRECSQPDILAREWTVDRTVLSG